MAYIPPINKVVTGFTINSGGSGYSSSPTVTIVGGDGQNATATATVVGGVITGLTITNQGSGYLSAPIVSISDSTGVGADITAIVEELDYRQKLEHIIQRQLPEFIQVEHSGFVDFLEGYYRFLDQTGQANDVLLNMASFSDIDKTADVFVEYFRKQFASEFPINTEIGLRRLVKIVRDFYESKGSEDSVELLFKILFNESIEIFYPTRYVLRASDGIWVKNTVFRVVAGGVDVAHSNAPSGNIFDLKGKIVDVHYYKNSGSIVVPYIVEATVTNVTKLAYTDPPVYEIQTDLPGSYDLKIPGAGAEGNLIVLDGAVKAITGENLVNFDGNSGVTSASDTITVPSHRFITGDPVIYHDGGGTTISGLTDGDLYYIIRVDDDNFKLATTSANASAGTAIDISAGSGIGHCIYGVDKTFEPSDINVSNNTITISAHGYSTGDVVLYQYEGSGSSIGGLTQLKTYYVIEVNSTTIQLANSFTNAQAGTAIDLTGAGTGTQTFSRPMVEEGNGFYAAPNVEFISLDSGTGATGRAVISSTNTISHIIVNEEGDDYVSGRTSLVLNSDSIRTHLHETGTLTPVYGYLQRQLSTVTVQSCTGTPPCGFKVGDLIVINEGAEPYAIDYFAEDYTEAFSNNNAIIKITAIDSDGCPTAAEIFNPGFGFTLETFTVEYTHPISGCIATFLLTTGPLRVESGYWKDSRGKISDANYLQDNFYYQDYSYVIRSGVESSRWLDILKKTLHPAGTEVFGELIITQTADFASNIGIGGNIHFYEFDPDDEVFPTETHEVDYFKSVADSGSASETSSVLFNKILADATSGATDDVDSIDFEKVVSDSLSVVEEPAFNISKVLLDSTAISDVLQIQRNFFFSDDIVAVYFAEDYVEDGYVVGDGGVSDAIDISVSNGESEITNATDTLNNFLFGKGLSDVATTSEATSNVIFKSLSDSVSISDVIAKELPDLILTDSGTISDEIAIARGQFLTDSITTSESVSRILQLVKTDTGDASELIFTEVDYNREPGDLIGVAESSRVVINKGLAEVLGITDSGIINIQNFVESGYISGVGDSGDTFGSNFTF